MCRFRNISKLVFIISALITTLACSSLYDQKTYSDRRAEGKISGLDWNYGYAYTDPEVKLPAGQTIMIILTVEKPAHACPNPKDLIGDSRNVGISFDGRIGKMTLVGPSDNVENADTLFKLTKITRHATIAFNNPNLAKGSQFIFATHGKLNITKVSPEAIHGKFLAKFDKENFANGQFKAKLCKYGQLN